MLHLTFKPAKDSWFIPKLVQCLSVVADAFLLLLMAWNLGNLLYPIFGWIHMASIWIGLLLHPIFFWIIERFRIRAFVAAKYRPTDQRWTGHENHLRHFGFLFSVWENPDSLTLGFYHPLDKFYCPRKRLVSLGSPEDYEKWLGWLLVLSTDAIPVAIIIGLFCAGYFAGIVYVVYFVMGLILALQLHTLCFRFGDMHFWDKEMFLGRKMCTSKSLGLMMCVMEGPEGELFLTLTEVVLYDHYERNFFWFRVEDNVGCGCCSSVLDHSPPKQNL